MEFESVWNGRDSLLAHEPVERIENICIECWSRSPTDKISDRFVCKKCKSLRNKKYMRRKRVEAKAADICIQCFKAKAVKGRTVCAPCNERNKVRAYECRDRDTAAGRCWGCGVKNGNGGRYCDVCKEDLKLKGKVRRAELTAKGLCKSCGNRRRAKKRDGKLAVQCRMCLDREAAHKRARRKAAST